MKPAKSTKVSLGDVAKAADVSKATACYVLRNRPGPSPQTRQKVLQVASDLGYAPNADAALLMSGVRKAKSKELIPIAWLNSNSRQDAWQFYKFLSPYLEGAQGRARELGYRVEQIWTKAPGMTMRRIARTLQQRGIEAVIVSHPARHLRLNWNSLAGIALEGGILAPRLHRVSTDYLFNLMLTLKVLKRFGYRRIGICFEDSFGRASRHPCFVVANQFHAATPEFEQIPPLFYFRGELIHDRRMADQLVVAWIRQYKPDVIVGHSNGLVRWVEMAGFRVPEEVGVAHIAIDEDVSSWAGIISNRREIGAVAAERVISLLQNRQFGVPETDVNMLIRGTWSNGRTLLTPKPKARA